jgi:hypothetical protein
MAAVAKVVVNLSSSGLLRIQPKLGIAFAPLDITTREPQDENC